MLAYSSRSLRRSMNISKARSIGQLAYFCGCLALLEGRPNFLELRACELRRIHLPRTRVNMPPAYAPDPSGWHHGPGVDPLEERRLARRRTSMSAEKNKALVRRFLEAHAKGD